MMAEKEPPRGWGEQLIPDKLIPSFILQGSVSRYIWAGQFVGDRTVLDVGCGSGYGTNYFKSRGARSVIGGDMSPEAVTYAGKHYQDPDLRFLVLDAERLPFPDNSFDIVTSFEVIEHVERYQEYAAECCRVLRDDGIFICSTPNAQAAGANGDKPLARYHHKEFYADEFRDLLAQHFGEVELFGMDPQKPGDKTVYRLATMLQSKIFAIPKIHLLTNLVTLFVFRRYRLIKMGGAERNIEKIGVRRLQPYPFSADAPLPGDLIAVGKGKR
jgi:SAM-dependent methyltransferase